MDESPEAFRTPQSFYKTESEIDQAVAGVYRTNRVLYNNQTQLRFGETRSDNTNIEITGDAGGVNDDQLNEFTMDATNGNLLTYWNTNYEGISRANFVLANIESVEFFNEDDKNFRIGELLFFRAMYHFNLTQIFGDIPYVIEPGENPDQILSEEFLVRDPQAEVYSNIEQDVLTAIGLLPNPQNLSSEDIGRSTKGAALMLQAKVFMAQQKYPQAISPLERIQTLGYQLLPNYADVFGTKNNKEGIFEVQYDQSLGQSSNFFTNFVPFVSEEDILGTGATPNNRGNQFRPTDDLIELYAEEDQRKAQNISIYTDDNGDQFQWGSKYAFPFVIPGEQNINWQMYRYADALLMLAECYEKTGSGDPIPLLLQIRTRAGLDNPNLSPNELGDLEKAISDERRRELVFEGHRYFDLLRTGKLQEVMTAHGEDQIQKGLTVTGNPYQNIRTLFGIPQAQVDQFGFQQNEGW
ncbi:RagB/SusD family nutrient uptake outer membrane protein [Joostella atrarenae]|uniref:RagB/SusD family nutrient uptake outer membrane protein n=1 Tax=Joostella atrarenae TaxID=679257 RepID=A0ABS9J4W1_9FLAO|nr:RagB/SusD family nutrient uptake outer membrane protein [Joostella atrarenae]MCF8715473.1 RagB/SusD family nutrient uptake outer membrane protein [Joostella atrarenae]